jgi:hypothetical protein
MLERGVLGLRPQGGPGTPRVVNIADSDNAASKRVSTLLAEILCRKSGLAELAEVPPGGDPGSSFEGLIAEFLQGSLAALTGDQRWEIAAGRPITGFAQYHHLSELDRLSEQYPELRLHLGTGYLIRPDVVVFRHPMTDTEFGEAAINSEDGVAKSTFLRQQNAAQSGALPILHASVSSKWTLRSDRAQNARSEALNLIRGRKGRVPAITLVTAEPMPSRIASVALGTGDIDRVYSVFLYELQEAVEAFVQESPRQQVWKTDLEVMVNGLRLADISDLPFDLLT